MINFTDKINAVYISDLDGWYELDRHTRLSEDRVLERIQQRGGEEYVNRAKAASYMYTMMEMGITKQQYEEILAKKKKVKLSDLPPDSIYSEVSELLPFKLYVTEQGHRAVYYLKNKTAVLLQGDEDEQLVAALMANKNAYAKVKQTYHSSPIVEKTKGSLDFNAYLSRAFRSMRMDETRVIDQPKLISWNPDEIAYCHFDAQNLADGPTPTWDEFTSRLDFPEVFMAWVWTIFDETNKSRQIMWLVGAGNDGKSVVMDTIKRILGAEYVAAVSADNLDTNWFFAQTHGKRLTLFSDCASADIVQHPRMKQLTGVDNVPVEFKGENSFLGQAFTKVLVSSNNDVMPTIDIEDTSHTSRLIKLDVSATNDRDSQFGERLYAERFQFLFKCRQAAARLLNEKTGNIDLPGELIEKIYSSCASSEYMLMNMFIDNNLDLGKDYSMHKQQLERLMIAFLKENFISISKKEMYINNLLSRGNKLGIKLVLHREPGKPTQTVIAGMRIKPNDQI